MRWISERGLTLVLSAVFAMSVVGQIIAGRGDFNEELQEHGRPPLTLSQYLRTGHMWEATFENWESEFLQMAAFVMLTAWLVQKGSPESRRPGTVEEVDADPRRFTNQPDVPWPVRRGGVVLWLYEYSLGLTFAALFIAAWTGHLIGGWHAYRMEEQLNGRMPPLLLDYLTSTRFWFESFQNWQSEFLSIAAMVWLSVYLRYRGSPESKPVHAAHHDS
jgi:hypothetical protein